MDTKKNYKGFLTIMIGQFASILGSSLSDFGLSVWILTVTGIATPFALSFLVSMLPRLIFAPFSGTFADRKNRKHIMIITDSLDALLKMILIIFIATSGLKLWMVYPAMFISSSLGTFQSPAANASVPMLVPDDKLSHANGLLQLRDSAQSTIAPVLAGALYPIIGLKGLFIIDFITFFVGIISVIIVDIPQEKTHDEVKQITMGVFFSDFKDSIKLIGSKKRFRDAIISIMIMNFIINISMTLLGPLIMTSYSSAAYGTIRAINSVSMLLGSFVASTVPEAKNKYKAMYIPVILCGTGIVISGTSEKFIVISTGMFILFLLMPYVNTQLEIIFQRSFDSNTLGRIGATMSAMVQTITPISYLIAGPLADKVFEPLMKENGALGKSFIGRIIGTGAGRGIGLIFILSGLLLMIYSCIMLGKVIMSGAVFEAEQ